MLEKQGNYRCKLNNLHEAVIGKTILPFIFITLQSTEVL